MPSGAVEQQDGVRAHGDMARDFIEMKLHGGSVGEGQSERRALAARRTDRAEEIGILVALIGRLRGREPRLAHCARGRSSGRCELHLETRFRSNAFRDIGEMGAQRLREVFL